MATSFRLGQEVAALVPGAALFPLPGSSHLFYHGDWAGVADTMLGFLGEPAGAQAPLTARELEVAGLIADGLTSYSIALRLSIAPRTAEAHVENIRRKLQVHSRAQIARWVTEHRLRTQRLGSSADARCGSDHPGLGPPRRVTGGSPDCGAELTGPSVEICLMPRSLPARRPPGSACSRLLACSTRVRIPPRRIWPG